MTLQRVQIWFT